jgi:hypothetical protein
MIRTTNHHKEIKKATTFTITMMGQLVGFAKSTHWDHPFCERVAILTNMLPTFPSKFITFTLCSPLNALNLYQFTLSLIETIFTTSYHITMDVVGFVET